MPWALVHVLVPQQQQEPLHLHIKPGGWCMRGSLVASLTALHVWVAFGHLLPQCCLSAPLVCTQRIPVCPSCRAMGCSCSSTATLVTICVLMLDLEWVQQFPCCTSVAVVGTKQPKEKVGCCGGAEHLWQDVLFAPGGDGGPTAVHAASRGFLLPEHGVHQGLDPNSQPELGTLPAACWALLTRCAWRWLLCRQAGGGRARCSAVRITMTSAAGADTTKINTVVIRRNRPNMDVSMEVASGCGDKRQGLAGVDKEV